MQEQKGNQYFDTDREITPPVFWDIELKDESA